VLDWMMAIRIPVILVAGSYLGSISHTLTCLEVMRRRDIPVRAVVINESDRSTVTVEDTAESIALFAKGLPVLSLKRAGASDQVLDRICALRD